MNSNLIICLAVPRVEMFGIGMVVVLLKLQLPLQEYSSMYYFRYFLGCLSTMWKIGKSDTVFVSLKIRDVMIKVFDCQKKRSKTFIF